MLSADSVLLNTEEPLFREKCEFIESPLGLAITMAARLLSSNVAIDVTRVLEFAAHVLRSSTFGKKVKDLMKQVCEFLLVMCGHRDFPVATKNVVAAVRLMVTASAQLYGKQTFLHILVDAWAAGRVPTKHRRSSCSAVQPGVFSGVKYLLTQFLDEMADPNAMDVSNETAAHRVIRSYCCNPKLSVEEGVALLELFDGYGLHWDAYFGNRRMLVDVLEDFWNMAPLATRLRSRPRSLQCLAAHAASGPACNTLPKTIQQFIKIHKPDSALSYKYFPCQRAGASKQNHVHASRFFDCYETNNVDGNYYSGLA